jgi:hypothetical protein
MVFEHEREFGSQCAALKSIGPKIGFTAELCEVGSTASGKRDGLTSDEKQGLKEV